MILFFIQGFRIFFGSTIGVAWNAFIGYFESDRCTRAFAPGLLHDELELDEDIELYQNCLDGDDRAWTV
mgnify:CR=1 FL=1